MYEEIPKKRNNLVLCVAQNYTTVEHRRKSHHIALPNSKPGNTTKTKHWKSLKRMCCVCYFCTLKIIINYPRLSSCSCQCVFSSTEIELKIVFYTLNDKWSKSSSFSGRAIKPTMNQIPFQLLVNHYLWIANQSEWVGRKEFHSIREHQWLDICTKRYWIKVWFKVFIFRILPFTCLSISFDASSQCCINA